MTPTTQTARPKRLISIADLCTKLDVARSTLWRLRREEPGFPQAITVGGSVRYDEYEIDEWLERQREGAA